MDKNKEKDRLFQPAGGRLLQQSVLKHIRRRADGIVEGAALGYDAAIFQSGDSLILQGIGAQPTLRFDETASLTAGEAAWITAENQLAACGVAMYRGTMVQVLLAAGMSCPEERIRREMQRISALSTERSCPIVGGNTVFHGRGDSLLIQVVMTAHLAADRNQRRKPAAGDRVFFLGETGCLGADLLARRCREKLRERFSESYIASMEAEKQRFSTIEMSRIAYESGAVYLHDVSNCGVHAALYQLAEAAGTGIRIRHEGLLIRQSVIELCEALGINPYQLLGTGGLLAVVPAEKAEDFASKLREAGISCGDAGELTKEKAKVIHSEDYPMERYLNLPEEDALDVVIQNDEIK